MTKPLISLIIPTIGRKTLARLLNSIPIDDFIEVLIVGDSFQNDFTNDILDFVENNAIAKSKNLYWLLYNAGIHS